jgi:acyl-coenzyme A thioesterase PaaI-like protein
MHDDSHGKRMASPSNWIPDDQPPEGQRAALHRLAAALRALNSALMETAAGEDELNAAASTTEDVLARLDALPKHRALWGWAESSNSGDTRAHFDNSPVMGLANAVAPPLRLWIAGDHVEGTANFGTAYEGPPGHVHGGWVAAAFDEVLGMAQSLTGNPGMTGSLVIRYRRPTPLHRDLHFVGRVDRVDGRKIFTTGTLHDGETLCGEAEGIFVSVNFDRIAQLAADR